MTYSWQIFEGSWSVGPKGIGIATPDPAAIPFLPSSPLLLSLLPLCFGNHPPAQCLCPLQSPTRSAMKTASPPWSGRKHLPGKQLPSAVPVTPRVRRARVGSAWSCTSSKGLGRIALITSEWSAKAHSFPHPKVTIALSEVFPFISCLVSHATMQSATIPRLASAACGSLPSRCKPQQRGACVCSVSPPLIQLCPARPHWGAGHRLRASLLLPLLHVSQEMPESISVLAWIKQGWEVVLSMLQPS